MSGGSASCPRGSAGGSPARRRRASSSPTTCTTCRPAGAGWCSDTRWFPVDKLATRLARAQLAPVPPHLGRRRRHLRAGRRPPARGGRVDRERHRDGQPHLGSAERRGEHPAEPVGAVRQHPDPGHRGHRRRAVGRRRAGQHRRPRRPCGDPGRGRLPARGDAHPGPAGRAPGRRRRWSSTRPPSATRSPDSPWCRAPTRRCCTPSTGSHSRPTAPSWPASTPTATASRAGGAPTATRCRSTRSTSATRRTTAAATCGWAASAPRTPTAPRLWVVDQSVNPAEPRAAATAVAAAWLEGRRVLESRVAPDGDRVAVLSTRLDGSDTRIDLAGIVRARGGLPQRLAQPLRVGASLTGRPAWPGSTTAPSPRSARSTARPCSPVVALGRWRRARADPGARMP